MLKKFIFYLMVAIIFLLVYYISNSMQKTFEINSIEELQKLFESPQKNVIVNLQSGNYYLQPTHFVEETCGNCEEANTAVNATFGLKISGKNIRIMGPEDRSAIIHTNSGYGLYVLDCVDFYLENVTFTDGIRDTSAMVSDAAIVVKNSRAFIENNLITNNLGDSLMIAKHISGIMGICCRENSSVSIINNEIIRNSWDGIALYRDAEAIIEGNIIDGIDKAGGRVPGGGRGVAIGVTWNAKAKITDNYIARYWKGIGLFVDAVGVVQNNIIEDMSTWGISIWDAGKGKPQGYISKNIIYDTGAMGAAITSSTEEEPGFFKDNIIVHTAQNSVYDSPDYYGYQCALALHSIPSLFVIEDNLFYNNRRASDDLLDLDANEDEFQQKLKEKQVWIEKLKFIGKSEFGKVYLNH